MVYFGIPSKPLQETDLLLYWEGTIPTFQKEIEGYLSDLERIEQDADRDELFFLSDSAFCKLGSPNSRAGLSYFESPRRYCGLVSETKQRFGKLLERLRNNPELVRRLAQFFSLNRDGSISRRTLINKYLMAIPEFQALCELAEEEVSALWRVVVELIDWATNWLCGHLLPLHKTAYKSPVFGFSISHFRCEQEKLWPLLMAFKNH